jgi:cytochrome c oxidase subunit 1
MSHAAWTLGAFQLLFLINFFMSLKTGKPAGPNPWNATTLDFAATTSPPLAHGNFATEPHVYRGPYEYSVPGASSDFTPQNADRT